MSKNILGNEVKKHPADVAKEFKSKEELKKTIAYMFTPKGFASFLLSRDLNRFVDDGWGEQAIMECLRDLPYNHPIVLEVIDEANRIFQRTTKMSALELKELSNPEGHIPSIATPIVAAFSVGDVFHPDEIFGNLETAAYHVVNQHVSNKKDLPYIEPVQASIRGFIGYTESKRRESLEFAKFLEKHNIGIPYLVNLYAKLGEVQSLEVFKNALVRNENSIDFGFVGRITSRKLKEIGKEKEMREYVISIQDEALRSRITNYFKLG